MCVNRKRIYDGEEMISKQDAQEFLQNMARIYYNARKSGSRGHDHRVIRGRARCVATNFEDEFAYLICRKALWEKEKGLRVFSDFPITIMPICNIGGMQKMKRCETRYIDIMICAKRPDLEYEILYMAELKTNTGWMRGQVSECLVKNRQFVEHLTCASTKVSVRKESLKEARINECSERIRFQVSQCLCYDLVVLSSCNNSWGSLDDMKSGDKSTSSLIVLTDDPLGGQPKDYRPFPRHEDFKELDSRIRCCLGHKAK